jgi:hypothetical protein
VSESSLKRRIAQLERRSARAQAAVDFRAVDPFVTAWDEIAAGIARALGTDRTDVDSIIAAFNAGRAGVAHA